MFYSPPPLFSPSSTNSLRVSPSSPPTAAADRHRPDPRRLQAKLPGAWLTTVELGYNVKIGTDFASFLDECVPRMLISP